MAGLEKLAQLIATHQALLQKIGVNWGALITEKLDVSERRLLQELERQTASFGSVGLNAATAKKFREIQKSVSKIRGDAFADAQAEIESQALQLADNDAKWAASLTRTMGGEGIRQIPGKTIEQIAQHGTFDGKTIEEWFKFSADADVSRIMSTVRQGVTDGRTISQIRKLLTGTAARNFEDGILQTSRREAEALARTVASGVSDAAKMEFYRANDDVVTGIEHVSTLDGRVCPACASVDGKRYETAGPVPSLPLHPNCRCVHVPVTELSDLDGDTRPAAADDFNAAAKKRYEQKYPGKEFDKLSASTRKKYYYDEIRNYERRTGKPPFEQAPGRISFREWFPSTGDAFQKSWLGPVRYDLYKNGGLPLDRFLPPLPDKRFTISELAKSDKEAFRKIRKVNDGLDEYDQLRDNWRQSIIDAGGSREVADEFADAYTPAVAKLGPPPRIILNKKKGAYFSPKDGEIHMSSDASSWNGHPLTARHEFGHWLDYQTRLKGWAKFTRKDLAAAVEEFNAAAQADWDRLKTLAKGNLAAYKEEFRINQKTGAQEGGYWNALSKRMFGKPDFELDLREQKILRAYQDTVGSISNGNYGGGHTRSYYRNQWGNEEAFAQVYSACSRGDGHFKLDFPNMFAYIEKLMKGLEK